MNFFCGSYERFIPAEFNASNHPLNSLVHDGTEQNAGQFPFTSPVSHFSYAPTSNADMSSEAGIDVQITRWTMNDHINFHVSGFQSLAFPPIRDSKEQYS
jgi:hypothetical protein